MKLQPNTSNELPKLLQTLWNPLISNDILGALNQTLIKTLKSAGPSIFFDSEYISEV